MKKKYFLLLLIFIFPVTIFSQSIFCNPFGNIALFSNYDGGTLHINCDMNIPAIKIGIVGYENDSVIISGIYSPNVVQVIFAGYYNSANVHCTPWPSVKSINGVSAAITQINFVPLSTYFNPYGYSYIICNYSCDDSTSQGGCNTPDQIAAYFFSQFGSSNLLFHKTQYGCWTGIQNFSSGGNCCIVPSNTAVSENVFENNFSVSPNPSSGNFHIKFNNNKTEIEIRVEDVLGKYIFYKNKFTASDFEIDLTGNSKGIYFLKVFSNGKIINHKLVID